MNYDEDVKVNRELAEHMTTKLILNIILFVEYVCVVAIAVFALWLL